MYATKKLKFMINTSEDTGGESCYKMHFIKILIPQSLGQKETIDCQNFQK